MVGLAVVVELVGKLVVRMVVELVGKLVRGLS